MTRRTDWIHALAGLRRTVGQGPNFQSFADFDPATHRADVAKYECKSRRKGVAVT